MKKLALILFVGLLMASSVHGQSVYEASTEPLVIQIMRGTEQIKVGDTVNVNDYLTISCPIMAEAHSYWSGHGTTEVDYIAQVQSSLKVVQGTTETLLGNLDVEEIDSDTPSLGSPDNRADVNVNRTLSSTYTVVATPYGTVYEIRAVSNAYAKYEDESEVWQIGKVAARTITLKLVNSSDNPGVFKVEAETTYLLTVLSNDVQKVNNNYGIPNSLDTKLDAALKALDDTNENNDVAAINSLEAFKNAVTAQSGNKIPAEVATGLIEQADAIIALLGG